MWHLPENAPLCVLPMPDSRSWLHPKAERFEIWLASVPWLAASFFLAWPSMLMGRSWRGALGSPETMLEREAEAVRCGEWTLKP